MFLYFEFYFKQLLETNLFLLFFNGIFSFAARDVMALIY